MTKIVCYCFGYTNEDIKNDLLEHKGVSTIANKIVEMKKKGLCQCKIKHPESR